MRHRKSGRKFGIDSSARKALLRNLVTSLLEHGKIRTTEPKAKELRRFAEHVVTIAKRAPTLAQLEGLEGAELLAAKAKRVHAIRRARRWVTTSTAIERLFGEFALTFAERPGGYTRVIKTGNRPGDNAAMAVIEFLGQSLPVAAPVDEASSEATESV